MSKAFIQQLQAKRAEKKSELDALLATAVAASRDLNTEESARFDVLEKEIKEIDARVAELDDQVVRDEAAAEIAKRHKASIQVGREPRAYDRGNGHSYFLDLVRAKMQTGDGDGGPDAAAERLARHAEELKVDLPKLAARRAERAERELRSVHQESAFERRANPNRVDGQGGYFVPPEWLVSDYIDLPRFGRTLANSVRNLTLPGGTDSINIPKVNTGTATGVQTADAAAVTSQDITDTYVTAPVRTIAGQQDIAQQLLDQSPAAFDEIVFADLIADYNQKVDLQCWSGTGVNGQMKGILNVSGINAITYTDGSPTVPKLYVPFLQAVSQSATKRKMMPTASFMTPARWFWAMSQLDSQNRPLVTPDAATAFNPLALQTGGDVEGYVGRMGAQVVMADGNIPTTLGAGSNEDRIATMRTSDLFLWEGAMRTRVMTEILSGTLQVRVQVYNYTAFMPDRRPETISVVSGTGLIAPAGF